MKVAFIVHQFPSLSQTFILRQVIGLLERGHEVDIFAYGRGEYPVMHRDIETYDLLNRTYYLAADASSPKIVRLIKRMGLLVTNFHKNPGAVLKTLNVMKFGQGALFLRVLRQVTPFLNKGPYDILHCQFGPNGNLGLLVRDTGVLCGKIITTFHGYDISSYTRSQGQQIYGDLFRRGDLFMCVSDRIKAKLTTLGCEEPKIIVHRCGIDAAKVHCFREPEENGRVAVLTIARLVEKKGVEYAIRAVGKLLAKHACLEYNIVGDGPLRPDLQNLIEELQVGKNVRFVGWKRQEEILELLRKSDVFLAPSVTSKNGDEEGIPVAIMEAFARGLPVISTYHAGIPELVKDGESGFLVPERDADALAERLEWLIERPELRFAMGRNGRRFVEEHYDVDKLNDRLVRIYEQLLDGELPHLPARLHASPRLP